MTLSEGFITAAQSSSTDTGPHWVGQMRKNKFRSKYWLPATMGVESVQDDPSWDFCLRKGTWRNGSKESHWDPMWSTFLLSVTLKNSNMIKRIPNESNFNISLASQKHQRLGWDKHIHNLYLKVKKIKASLCFCDLSISHKNVSYSPKPPSLPILTPNLWLLTATH